MKAFFRPFALHAAYTPIETIVFFCIIGTLAYFHILNAIKHSAFLDPAATGNIYAPPVMKPAHALFRLREWVGVGQSTWVKNTAAADASRTAVELQQVVFIVDGVRMKGSEVCVPFLLASLYLKRIVGIRPPLISSSSSPFICNQHIALSRHRLCFCLRQNLPCTMLSN